MRTIFGPTAVNHAKGVRRAILVAALVALAGQSVQPIAAQPGPGPGLRPDVPGAIGPTEGEPDPQAPWSALEGMLADIETLVSGRPGAGRLPADTRARLDAVTRSVSEAQAAYGSPDGSILRSFEAMGAAARQLAEIREPRRARFQAELRELSRRLAAVARGLAADATEVARGGGAGESVLAEANAALEAGDDAVAQVMFNQAIDSFADAYSIIVGVLVFDLDLLEDNIRGALDGETVGYSYAIARDGLLHATSAGVGGLARRAVDAPETAQSPTKEMYTASISKTISATALLKALHDEGISVDSAIGAYLPADWVQGEDLDLVTFRHLLGHTSGLDPANASASGKAPQRDASLQSYIAQGSDDAQRGNHNYRNANYSLMRVLIPRVAYGGLVDYLANSFVEARVHAGLYQLYVSDNVLEPAGISQNRCQPAESADARTLLYPLTPGVTSGLDAGDWGFECGATGWFLSAVDLASFLAYLRFTDDILEPQTRSLMDQAFLGWLDPVQYATWVQGTWGTYRAHQGNYTNMTGCIMNFPSAANPDFPGVKVQVSLLVNSTGGTLGQNLPVSGPRHLCKVLKEAYDAAWVSI